MKIYIGAKYRVIDESRFMPEHEIKNGDEFVVHGIDHDGEILSHDISWNGAPGDDISYPDGFALLMNGRAFADFTEGEQADYSGSIEKI